MWPGPIDTPFYIIEYFMKYERWTSNVQRRTSNNDVAALHNLIFLCFKNPLCFFFFYSKFDVGRSMFDVHILSPIHVKKNELAHMVLGL